MSLNKEFNSKLTQSTTKLIAAITNFKEGSVNHTSCLEYAVSNFHYHRYLDPDSNKLQQSVKGISDKFYVHSQPIKANALTKNYETFINNTIFENIYQKSQVHFKLISILLELSTTPLQKEYFVKQKPEKLIVLNQFDWGAYLLEGEEQLNPLDWDLSSEDEFEEDSDPEVSTNLNSVKTLLPDSNNNKQSNQYNNYMVNQIMPHAELNVFPSYWLNHFSKYDQTQSLNDVFKFQISKENLSEITEINICREVIWLLCGFKNLFVFVEKEGKIQVSDDFAVSHVTNTSLMNVMNEFAKCGNSVRKLQEFASLNVTQKSMTYQAFANSLTKYLKLMQTDLLQKEQQFMAQEQTFLLSDLKKTLLTHLTLVEILSKIFGISINLDQQTDSNAQISARLLGVLYNALIDESNLVIIEKSAGKFQAENVLFNIFVDSIKPYLMIIDEWISNGVLLDFNKEFVIEQRPKTNNQSVQSNKFWHDSIELVVSDVNLKLPWLAPLLNKIIVGGKSTEILQTMNVVGKNQNKNLKFHEENHNVENFFLYEKFKELINKGCMDSMDLSVDGKKLQLQASKGKNTLLNSNFANLFVGDIHKHTKDLAIDQEKSSTIIAIGVLIYNLFDSLLDIKCDKTNKKLLHAFKTQFKLTQTLDIFCNFYLMGWGDIMHHFCTEIFEQLTIYGTIKYDQIGLNVLLQDAIGHFSEPVDIFVTNVMAHAASKSDSVNYTLNVTDGIELQYSVKWPLNLIFTQKCIEIYKQVFTYLIKLKRAIFAVESLKFPVLEIETKFKKIKADIDMDKVAKSNRILMLRWRLLHLLKHWYGFVMLSVIQTEKEKLLTAIHNAKSLDNILIAHEEFLNQIFSLCFLSKEDTVGKLVQGTILKVMELALSFNMHWCKGVNEIPDSKLTKLEGRFKECSVFLTAILKPISARGALPLLDSLATAFLC